MSAGVESHDEDELAGVVPTWRSANLEVGKSVDGEKGSDMPTLTPQP
jgi:hypothetical protein